MVNHEVLTFCKVAETGSFSRAAKELFLSSVSVMNQMTALEKRVGAKLVDRTSRGTFLTAAGRAFYQDAQQIIALADAAARRARTIASAEDNVIRVGTSILRPCNLLIDLWAELDDGSLPFQIKIVPFGDEPDSLDAIVSSFGREIDCIVGPCDSLEWREKCSILQLRTLPCRVAVPRKHRLARKDSLTWDDLANETFLLIKRGDSPVLNCLRDEITQKHPNIRLVDAPNRYDTAVFNECEQMNYLMETLDVWTDIHPALRTVPMAWHYEMPYGILYSKKPSHAVAAFVEHLATRQGGNA